MSKSSKGSAFERELSKLLTTWVQGTPEPLLFWRGHGSGGMLTRNIGVGKNFSGDIYALDEKSMWVTNLLSIEAKNGYPSASFDKHLKNNKNDEIRDFWKQCIRDATTYNKIPILIFRKKGNSPWIGVPKVLADIYFNENKTPANYVHLSWEFELPEIYFFDMKHFLDIVNANLIKEKFNIK